MLSCTSSWVMIWLFLPLITQCSYNTENSHSHLCHCSCNALPSYIDSLNTATALHLYLYIYIHLLLLWILLWGKTSSCVLLGSSGCSKIFFFLFSFWVYLTFHTVEMKWYMGSNTGQTLANTEIKAASQFIFIIIIHYVTQNINNYLYKLIALHVNFSPEKVFLRDQQTANLGSFCFFW